jgi:hypothetical protein
VDVAKAKQIESASIQITKKRCDGRDTFPVFAESHCVDVPDAVFTLMDPRSIHAETLTSGESYAPDEWYFAGSNLWSLEDHSPDATMSGSRIVSCLASEPGSSWHSAVRRVIHSDESWSVSLDWMFVATGVPNQAFQPSLDCIWFELPDMSSAATILNLQAFTSESPYLNWTDASGLPLPNLVRGESGEDLEASMVMTNVDTGDVYSFAADAYGQVLVPAGTYSLVDTGSGLEKYFTMRPDETTLVEVGLASTTSLPSAPLPAQARSFGTGALYCDAAGCTPMIGITIHFESSDGSVSGSCVTEAVATPNGYDALCQYEYIPGIPTVLTLDESTLPAGSVVISENPQMYLVPEHPSGILGPVNFVLGPG